MIHVDESDPVGEVELSFPHRDVVIKRGVDAKEFYDLQSEIGRGKFGTVYRCVDIQTGLRLAAKFVPVARKEDRRNVEREVDIMRSLQHPRLIQLYDAFDCGKVMCVILEFIEGGELFERVIDDDFVLTEKSCTAFMRQICEGVDFIHKQNVLHLDMKPENILCLTKTGNRIKIIDFGLARRFDPDKKLQVLFGTPEFVAPEVVNFDQIGYSTDMWSVGVICYVLLSGLSPFMGETDVETMANVTIAKYDFDDEAFEKISNEAKDFIKKLLLKDKKERMTAKECLEHVWLRRKPPAPVPPVPSTKGLDMTKDNLRLFVERWAEHPNSPYLFDVSCHMISPLMTTGVQLASSHHSLRGMSPSPCGSLHSSAESLPDITSTSPDDNVFHHYTFDTEPHMHKIPQEFQTFERRSSDSSYLGRKTDIAERVNLAEEIRKLSDKLFKLSTMSDFTVPSISETITQTKKLRFSSSESSASQHIPLNNITANVETQRNIEDNGNIPWRRTKHKVTGMNRDVPLSSYNKSSVINHNEVTVENGTSKNTDRWTSNGTNNALGTKDLLLKLLDKWDDTQDGLRTATGRHKSISAECARLTAAKALEHPWLHESHDHPQMTLSKKKLKRYVIKKRWIKAVNTILALQRMGAKIDAELI